MNIQFQRLVDRYIGVPLCAGLSLIERIFGRDEVLGRPQNILVILLSEMGSLVLAEPMFVRLKKNTRKRPSMCCYSPKTAKCWTCWAWCRQPMS